MGGDSKQCARRFVKIAALGDNKDLSRERYFDNINMIEEIEGDLLNEKHARLLAFKTGFGCEVDEGFHFTFISNKWKFKLYTILLNLKSFLKR